MLKLELIICLHTSHLEVLHVDISSKKGTPQKIGYYFSEVTGSLIKMKRYPSFECTSFNQLKLCYWYSYEGIFWFWGHQNATEVESEITVTRERKMKFRLGKENSITKIAK